MNETAAILLAGGRGSRMGGVRKPLLEVGGVPLLDAAIAAARRVGCRELVAVGEQHADSPVDSDLIWVREDPPFAGPVAAILAALPLIAEPWTFVLACDLPRVGPALDLLTRSRVGDDGACLIDPEGHPQWLTGLYRVDALRAAGARLPDGGRDAAVRALLGPLQIERVAADAETVADIDTWDDLAHARRRTP